ncbi:MAG: Ku protein [Chloroflexi bacterium RBG_16_56_11]|nr:MAG: Ku protein [Chloroflexi bacterium RBG_16_56_11]
MPRAFWKGAISFGMVSIPVKMYIATMTRTPSFHMLHKKCLTRPRQVLHCEKDNEYFSSKDTVRGYEYSKEQYIVLKESDFEKVPVRTTHAIDITGFVKEEEIDPVYYYGSHYLEPEELAAKPFCLLREALRQSGRVGLAKVAFQRREHLGCIRPLDSIMIMHTMHYRDEILPRSEITVPEKEFTKDELKMAGSLIDVMVKKFDPGDYRDEYPRALEEIIKAKLAGQEIKVLEMPKYEEIPDLMSALKASIEAATRESATRPKAQKVPAARKTRA